MMIALEDLLGRFVEGLIEYLQCGPQNSVEIPIAAELRLFINSNKRLHLI